MPNPFLSDIYLEIFGEDDGDEGGDDDDGAVGGDDDDLMLEPTPQPAKKVRTATHTEKPTAKDKIEWKDNKGSSTLYVCFFFWEMGVPQ